MDLPICINTHINYDAFAPEASKLNYYGSCLDLIMIIITVFLAEVETNLGFLNP